MLNSRTLRVNIVEHLSFNFEVNYQWWGSISYELLISVVQLLMKFDLRLITLIVELSLIVILSPMLNSELLIIDRCWALLFNSHRWESTSLAGDESLNSCRSILEAIYLLWVVELSSLNFIAEQLLFNSRSHLSEMSCWAYVVQLSLSNSRTLRVIIVS